MRIMTFKLYEKYLQSGRHLLFHNTFLSRLNQIIDSDTLKISKNVSRGPAAICLSRNIGWTNDGSYECRIVLDSDTLLRNGHKSYPLQELMYKKGDDIRKPGIEPKQNVWKGRLDWYQKGKRMAPHGIDGLPQNGIMETEFEERLLKDVDNIGRYIVYIDILSEKDFTDNLISYVTKYSHIKVRLILDRSKPFLVKELEIPVKKTYILDEIPKEI